MNKRPFIANTWLNSPPPKPLSRQANSPEESNNNFNPSTFFIPGWQGESLISKPALNIKKISYALQEDARSQFQSLNRLNKSLKISIYNEFLSYANSEGINSPELDDYVNFWRHLHSPDSLHRAVLDDFIKVYCFRLVTIYLYKVSFIIQLCNSLEISPSENNLLNPTSFISKFFKKDSSSELYCESLQSNQYSWYRPTQEYHSCVYQLTNHFHLVSITERMKIYTYEQTPHSMTFRDSQYSHSLSHKAFGLFLNNLIIKFPQWLYGGVATENPNPYPSVLNCKYMGKHLTSLSLSHWLAQEHEINKKWLEIICPTFDGLDFINGTFVKICHELQFLIYLVEIAERQNYKAIDLICKIMKEKYTQTRFHPTGQMPMFPCEEQKFLIHDRIILNLAELPKNNPHHYLLAQLHTQYNLLQEQGFLYVMTNQQFFIPSRSGKVEEILEKYKLEACFDLEQLKGRGEIPSYIYIFKKRKTPGNSISETSYRFNFRGDLTIFNKFFNFAEEIEHFFVNRNAHTTPIYQKEVGKNLFLEYHQDAIVEGKLISSLSHNADNTTHPNFFKNLTRTCIPLDNFFNIESLGQNQRPNKQYLPADFLGFNLKQEERYPLALIVNQLDPKNIRLELVDSKSLTAKKEKYGHAYFQYFGLLPKIPNLNIDIFREFFNSQVGGQIIQLSLGGSTSKLKSKIKAMLIPSFFTPVSLARDIEESMMLLGHSADELFAIHPRTLAQQFESLQPLLLSLSEKHPWALMCQLTLFKQNLQKCIERFDGDQTDVSEIINYSNPLLIGPLLQLKSHRIYPDNNEVYIEIMTSTRNDLQLRLTDCVCKKFENNACLELHAGERILLQIYSDPIALSFIRFILSSAAGTPIISILEGLKIPRITELQDILHDFEQLNECFHQLDRTTNSLITSLLEQQISGRQ